jgi:hypothetical protein
VKKEFFLWSTKVVVEGKKIQVNSKMNGKNLPPDKVEVSGEMGSHRATFAHHNSQPESVEVSRPWPYVCV